jgi:hypothetical protein
MKLGRCNGGSLRHCSQSCDVSSEFEKGRFSEYFTLTAKVSMLGDHAAARRKVANDIPDMVIGHLHPDELYGSVGRPYSSSP